ncbi:transposase [Yersinia ruckeri]|uniref:transposase n=1 Tax=Yersinia ruckeri TaxID=29486 RepID=UPI000AD092CD
MKRISPERKACIMAKLLPPYSMTVAAIAQMDGISEATLYNWQNQAKAEGNRFFCRCLPAMIRRC